MQHSSAVVQMRRDLAEAGYFPEFIEDTIARSVASEPVLATFVHPETTLEAERFQRHVTVLVLTPSRLLVNHTDESETRRGDYSFTTGAASTTESIPLGKITAVSVSRVCARPERYDPHAVSVESWLQIGWGIVQRVELVPAACEDASCEADHGYTGDVTSDDLVVRVSATVDGQDKVAALEQFGYALQAATGDRS